MENKVKFKVGDEVRIIKTGKVFKVAEGQPCTCCRTLNNGSRYRNEELELVQPVTKEDKPLTLADIKVGMKVVPFKKSRGFMKWSEWDSTIADIPNFFKQNKYLLVKSSEEDGTIHLGDNIQSKYGDMFDISDITPYIEPTETKPKYSCGYCNKEYDEIEYRMECEIKCKEIIDSNIAKKNELNENIRIIENWINELKVNTSHFESVLNDYKKELEPLK